VRNTAAVMELIRQKVRASDGRISAKRLLPVVRAAGYVGSPHNFRRAVAEAKAGWKKQQRSYRRWVPNCLWASALQSGFMIAPPDAPPDARPAARLRLTRGQVSVSSTKLQRAWARATTG
jgi:hypothetical protein